MGYIQAIFDEDVVSAHVAEVQELLQEHEVAAIARTTQILRLGARN